MIILNYITQHRIWWLYNKLMKMLDKGEEGIKMYQSLPSFSYMLSRFWVRDIEKFIGKKQRKLKK